MTIVVVAGIYVALLMAMAEAFSTQGTRLGAIVTFVLCGLLPLPIVLWVPATPARRKLRRERGRGCRPRAGLTTAWAARHGRKRAR